MSWVTFYIQLYWAYKTIGHIVGFIFMPIGKPIIGRTIGHILHTRNAVGHILYRSLYWVTFCIYEPWAVFCMHTYKRKSKIKQLFEKAF